MDLLHFIFTILALIGLAAVLAVLLAAVYIVIFDPDAVHWPEGLDEEPRLDVQNHIGDSRPVR